MPFNTQAPWTVTTVNIVTVSRALDVVYTNNTGKTMFVYVTLVHDVLAMNDASQANAKVNGVSVGVSLLNNHYAAVQIQEEHMIVFAVPPGKTYEVAKLVIGTGILTIWQWVESY